MIFFKRIMFFDNEALIICDGNCKKAWGMNSRPHKQFSDDPDDWENIPDDELGIAPDDPGTYEGSNCKPDSAKGMNKWCARECERSQIVILPPIGGGGEIKIYNHNERFTNMPKKGGE